MADIFNPSVPGATVSPYPPELQQDARALARRRAIADMLLARTLAPLQQPTGPGGMPVPMSPFAAMQPLLSGYLGAKAQAGADEGDKALAARYSTGLSSATQAMLDKIKTGDYAGASQAAAPWPALKTIVEKLYERNLPEYQASEGVLFNKNAQNPAASTLPLQTYKPVDATVQTPTGPTVIPGQTASVTGKQTFPPANITNVQNFPANALATEAAKHQAALIYGEKGTLPTSRAEAEASARDLSLLLNVNDLAQTARFGSFQEFRNNIAKIAETAGFSTSKDASGNVISSTDNMVRQMAGRSLEVAKKLGSGSGFSNTDLAFLQRVRAGQDLDEEGMRKFMSLAFEADVKSIHGHNSAVEQAPEALPGFKQSYRVNLPADVETALQKGLKLGPPTSYEKTTTPPQGPIPAAALTPEQRKALMNYLNQSQTP